MGKLGDAVVEVYPDLKPLDAGLGQAERRISGFVGGARGMIAGLGISAGALGLAGVGASLLDCARKASDLGESLSKTRTTFGKDSGLIEAYADEMASKFGLVKRESIDAATSIGLVGQASGMSASESAKLGVEMARLAADISSFHNVGMEEALTTIRSGLVGEAEPLRRFGVLLSEDAVKAEALRLGLAKTTGELSEQAKVRARISLIKNAAAMKPVQGDLERTADSAANQIRKLEGDIENFKTKLGEAFVGPMTEAIKLATELGTSLGAISKDGAAPAAEWAQAWLGAIRIVNASWDPEKLRIAQKGGLQALADDLAGVKKDAFGKNGGLGAVDKNGNSWSSDPEELKRQMRAQKALDEKRKKEAADAAAATPAGKLAAAREASLTGDERRTRDQGRDALLDHAAYTAGQKGLKNSSFSFDQYRASRERSGLSAEDYDAARKKSKLAPEAFAYSRDSAQAKRDKKDVRGLETRAAGRGLLQFARQFGEKALDAASAVPDLASKDRGKQLAAQAALQNASGLLGPLGGNGARLLAAGGQAVGAIGRGVEAGKEQRARLGPSQVMGADDFARNNLTEAFNNERDKQLAAQEKANDFLAGIREGIEKIASKAADRGGAILRGRS